MANELGPTEREFDVLKVLWAVGGSKGPRCPRRHVWRKEDVAFTTVQTLLRIMADKKLVAQRTKSRALFYKAKYSPQRAALHFCGRCLTAPWIGSS